MLGFIEAYDNYDKWRLNCEEAAIIGILLRRMGKWIKAILRK